MNNTQKVNIIKCLSECSQLIEKKHHEASIRSVFNSYLRSIAGDPTPWWAQEHFVKTEAALNSVRSEKLVKGFADNLVGLTAIEYEKNLALKPVYDEGYKQVKEYVAGLLNLGANIEDVRGILSDTVRWYVFEIKSVRAEADVGSIAGDDITLELTTKSPTFDGTQIEETTAEQFLQFLELHLGRDAGQILSAKTLAAMFGIESDKGKYFHKKIEKIIDNAFITNPDYAELIKNLWGNFVSFIGTEDNDSSSLGRFEYDAYVGEFYLLTLAKLIAVNVINGQAVISNESELEHILTGQYFKSQGIINLVEYDYFGWLTKIPFIEDLISISHEIQASLKVFNYSLLKVEDFFGELVAQLSKRTQRILLGQEPTPTWLVSDIVESLPNYIGSTSEWTILDPCCGSGAFIVEVLNRRIKSSDFIHLDRDERGKALSKVITGFDIDPLAVFLAKVSWLMVAKKHLQPFHSGYTLSIPIYHCDSLFAITPLEKLILEDSDKYKLDLDGNIVELPDYLLLPNNQALFDDYLEGVYSLAQYCAHTPKVKPLEKDIRKLLVNSIQNTSTQLDATQFDEAVNFGLNLSLALTSLEEQGRNGLWLHMIKNGYRPALVKNNFNGIVTNFPWLSLSKLKNNPYKKILNKKAEIYNLKPQAQSSLHLELATLFFIHCVDVYLKDNGMAAAIVPNSVIEGTHHEPLRSQNFNEKLNISFNFREVWNIDKSAFYKTNVAAVLIGEKGGDLEVDLIGKYVGKDITTIQYPLYLSTLNQRNAWTKKIINSDSNNGLVFNQGADVMPRTLWVHEVRKVPGASGRNFLSLKPIDQQTSELAQFVKEAKKFKNFKSLPVTISEKWGFQVLLSTSLLQFFLNEPIIAVLPFLKRSESELNTITEAPMMTLLTDKAAYSHFQRIFQELESEWGKGVNSEIIYKKLSTNRQKIKNQIFAKDDILVLFGAGGEHPAAAKVKVTESLVDDLIIDQTLYWKIAKNEEEADYLVGLFNSSRLAEVIKPFQPKGNHGARHIHTLLCKAIPEWDENNPLHVNVVEQTRLLTKELFAQIALDENVRHIANTPANVASRRKKFRAIISQLPSYGDYDLACSIVL